MQRAPSWIGCVLPALILSGTIVAAAWAQQAATAPAPAAAVEGETVVVERVTTVRETQTRQIERQVDADAPEVRTVAIFVKNRAEGLDDKVSVLEDLLVANITDMGFHVISREDAANAVAAFATQGPNAGRPDLPGADLDALLSNNTSALRLAQNLDADYLFVASITTHDVRRREFEGYGINRQVREHTLRATYKILDRHKGGSLTAGAVKASEKTPVDAPRKPDAVPTPRDETIRSADDHNPINDLLDEAAQKLAANLKPKVEKDQIRSHDKERGEGKLQVVCHIADWTIPEVTRNDKGEYVVGESAYAVEAMDATVELNGAVIGSTPGPFEVPRGLSKIRVSRELCSDWERTVNVGADMTLRVAMQLSPEGRQRLMQNAQFLEGLKAGAKLTDAQVKVLEGFAETLRQSGLKVEIKATPGALMRSVFGGGS